MVLAIWLILGLQGTFTLEQPASSIIMRHHRLRQLLKVIRAPTLNFFIVKTIYTCSSVGSASGPLLYHPRCGEWTSGWSATATRLRSVLLCGQTLKMFLSSEPLSLRGPRSTPIPIWWSGIEIKKANPVLLEIARLWKIQRSPVKFVSVLWYTCLIVGVLFQNVVNQHAMEPKSTNYHEIQGDTLWDLDCDTFGFLMSWRSPTKRNVKPFVMRCFFSGRVWLGHGVNLCFQYLHAFIGAYIYHRVDK